MRNFGIMSRLEARGVSDLQPATRDRYSPRDLKLPPGSILSPADLPLPRSKFSQAMLDVLAICVGVLLVSVTGISVAGSLFMLLFIRF